MNISLDFCLRLIHLCLIEFPSHKLGQPTSLKFLFVLFIFIKNLIEHSVLANRREPNQTPQYAASDLDLHCLPMSHKKDAMLKWVKMVKNLPDVYIYQP